ncbi:Roadblock/LC7 family protein [Chloroherpeton thalassium ATCC 35110]|uniref:Roadblock/LC7 family protein n=1 Tax=Chloroherpeton thalassium (strain ATCC 35110 / GB-78) TaxID=517418 RepID=B3QU71_CHLT3|nr:DUF4388 domain-containing protein [Chloroherpeton thalassium]ACF12869.1 Roadblock/LC7 family protein [Chloroherpeton thalassium ATCC 35110]
MQGDIKHMSVADLIQHYCEDHKTAKITLNNDGQEAELFLKDGNVVHATMGDIVGEQVVFNILAWNEGTFNLDMDTEPSFKTIERSWKGLLLHGAQLLDESSSTNQPVTKPVEKTMVKKKGEIIAEALQELLQQSTDIQGAAIVGTDGLVYSANVPDKGLDENMVGAVSAAILGLSKRSVQQLKRGTFSQTLIQGDNGNVIVAGLNDRTLLIGLTAHGVNLGMAFAEVRDFASRLRDLV